MKTTISVIKADVGSVAGHAVAHEALKDKCSQILAEAKETGILEDYYITNCGDDIDLIMTHRNGEENEEVHQTAWNAFREATDVARSLKLYGAGQDLLSDTFSGNIKGMGPGCAEMEFKERPSDPVIIFCCDKTEPGAFNLPLFRMFADPFNTAGLVIDPSLHNGYEFEVFDVVEHRKVKMSCPDEMYDLLALLGSISRYVIKKIHRRDDGEIAASVSTERLNLMAGKYIGKDDPVAIVRAQSGFPAAGEVVEPFAFPHLVGGWMRGSHNGPLMPVAQRDATPVRFDGPPRVIGLGFQVADCKLVGPVDMFDDPAFDRSRALASEVAEYMRRHGPFEPHRLPSDEMEYTSLPGVLEKLGDRFEDIE
ncbi:MULTISPECIES: fructose-1,6-bisphosphate aldolase/phosphatase [Methanothermobacter]|uniref:Fructose-1,6-bisphosphate aldolase/phosphatase n=1 Tax=Methanothermobacter wolfeii TaxID=145261 RepID=A0A9E7RWX7_METWO|nr:MULTISPECIES: fructose-1,6-bisphosphate aldolase/phosphatase [Methanothermobacter]MDI6702896.1 fructose-1,6-bisphosphate aldolase/phosphatase [Methanothermobacter wolfeii]MDI6841425.1 fructose-1,6-bisphosphate aldolase/phosphatase [Methanothermobacter wolfeii]NLM02668.1 fructose 1,6-bisphosphatase [Methanothermobacter wolfeii]QHN05800.1 fructose 1,6-bisphosphatase [Methanothermobacter sp. THM-1]UXH31949.1 fructose-1,6-bisphosphate aldolase/phosphatase [Methanothermobacter wolfeii]